MNMSSAVTRVLYRTALRLRRRLTSTIDSEGLSLPRPLPSDEELRMAFHHADLGLWSKLEGKEDEERGGSIDRGGGNDLASAHQVGLELLQREHKRAMVLEEGRFIPRAEAKDIQFRVGDIVWTSKTAIRASRGGLEAMMTTTPTKTAGTRKKGVLAEDDDDEAVAAGIIGWTPSCLTPSAVSELTAGWVPSLIRNVDSHVDHAQPFYYLVSLSEFSQVEKSLHAVSAREFYATKGEEAMLRRMGFLSEPSSLLSTPSAGLLAWRKQALQSAGSPGRTDYLPQSALRAVSLAPMTTSRSLESNLDLAAFAELPRKVQALACAGVWWSKYYTSFDPRELHFNPSQTVQELYPEDRESDIERIVKRVAEAEREKWAKERGQDLMLREGKEEEITVTPTAPTKRAPRKKKTGPASESAATAR